MEQRKPNRKTVVGTVVSDKMDKSITVELKVRKKHPIYKKFVKQHSKVKAHDEENTASCGDLVKIIKTRPISKDKSWRIVQIIEKAQKEQ